MNIYSLTSHLVFYLTHCWKIIYNILNKYAIGNQEKVKFFLHKNAA